MRYGVFFFRGWQKGKREEREKKNGKREKGEHHSLMEVDLCPLMFFYLNTPLEMGEDFRPTLDQKEAKGGPVSFVNHHHPLYHPLASESPL